jgi:hypothetical protein
MPAIQFIRAGDEIICPRDGHPEKVVISRRHGYYSWFMRTSRHDHQTPLDRFIQLKEDADGQR